MDAVDDASVSEGSDLRVDNNEADIKPADSQIAVAVESPPQLSDQDVGHLGSSGSFLEQSVGNLGSPVDASCSFDGEEQEARTSFSVADGNPDLDWYADVDLSVRFFESKESGLEHPTHSLNTLSRGPSILSPVPEASEQIIDQSFSGMNVFDDARLQEGDVLKLSGQPSDQRMGIFGTSGSLNPGNTTRSPRSNTIDGADLKEELMLDGNLDLDLSKDIDLAVRFFESKDPGLERTLSTLSTSSIQGPERSLSGLSSSSEPASSTSYMAPSA